ncbi:hypothetical protein CEXT_503831 [Caerostris extrusa]|uniref:Uncharacterized protein n=1 Tax=Caerostris extrusa TaxID=172846 RepID=A0AAV4VVG5_CAEEX|nr:hypothetical protein CEXT_503831 [Caerostris extrusa]
MNIFLSLLQGFLSNTCEDDEAQNDMHVQHPPVDCCGGKKTETFNQALRLLSKFSWTWSQPKCPLNLLGFQSCNIGPQVTDGKNLCSVSPEHKSIAKAGKGKERKKTFELWEANFEQLFAEEQK